MYEGFKNALDGFTRDNEDVCRPVEHHIEAIHKMLSELGRQYEETVSRPNVEGRQSPVTKLRMDYIEECMKGLNGCLNVLIGVTMNSANIQDAMNRKRGALIVAKGALTPMKRQD